MIAAGPKHRLMTGMNQQLGGGAGTLGVDFKKDWLLFSRSRPGATSEQV